MPSAEDVFGTMAGAALSPLVSAASLLLRRRRAKVAVAVSFANILWPTKVVSGKIVFGLPGS
jgi:hypothetical protein